MKRHLTMALLATMLVLSGCSSADISQDSAESFDGPSATSELVTDRAQDETSYGAHSVGEVAEASVVTVGQARVRHDDPYSVSQDFIEDVEKRGGLVSSMDVEAEDENPRAEVTVKIPADQYQDFVDELKNYGTVVTVTTSSEDVTSQHVDLQARVDALQASVDRLSGLMEEAGSVEELLEAEQTLTDRQATLDSVRGQLNNLENRIAMSTLTVVFSTADSDKSKPSSRGGNPFSKAWDALLSSVNTLLIITLGLLPWVLVLGLIAWLTWRIVRRFTNRGGKPKK
ncbi:DUF4349 domain-containing protein [Corynebacterium cystitidis]|uniref:DUF4349 domain-containing protein n=1 Tax=Corynebacterium cystitidis TaxID=35757 RepID=UPI00211DE068|nr:DUF4349 domain-containing protein [Corynebacterium cystitidis]